VTISQAIDLFNGDLDMREITRDHAHAVRRFWQDRIHPTDGRKPMSGSTGNKDLGKIRATPNRQLKSGASKREIPLVGVALEAMRRAPNGFPHYRDRGYLLSQSLTKAFKARKLFPSPQHRIYSFRHSFEKRMLEAGLDYGLQLPLYRQVPRLAKRPSVAKA